MATRALAPPRADVIVAYKSATASMVEEYFSSGDVEEAGRILDGMEQPLYQHYFVKRLVTMSMDRGNRAKEAAACSLSRLFPHHVVGEQIQRGFERLLESVDDLAIDVPSAAEDLAMFVSRAIVDDILPPSFCTPTSRAFFRACASARRRRSASTFAHGHLSDRHCTERVLRRVGRPSASRANRRRQSRHSGSPARVPRERRRRGGAAMPAFAQRAVFPPRAREARAGTVHRGAVGAETARRGFSVCSRCWATRAR